MIESKTEPSVVKVQNYIAAFPSMGGGGMIGVNSQQSQFGIKEE